MRLPWWLRLREWRVIRDGVRTLTQQHQEVEDAWWRGIQQGRAEAIAALEEILVELPEYAKNSFRHLALAIRTIRGLPGRGEGQRGGGDGGQQATQAEILGVEYSDAAGATQGAEVGRDQVAPAGDRSGGDAEGRTGRGLQRPHQATPESAART